MAGSEICAHSRLLSVDMFSHRSGTSLGPFPMESPFGRVRLEDKTEESKFELLKSTSVIKEVTSAHLLHIPAEEYSGKVQFPEPQTAETADRFPLGSDKPLTIAPLTSADMENRPAP